MTKVKLTALLASFGLVGSLGVAAASDIAVRSLVDRDTDNSGTISAEEYSAGDAEDFALLDTDGDGSISAEEYSTGMFRMGDRDQDGELNAEEQEFLDTVRGANGVSQ